jgi:hypothetical protein
MTPSVVLSRLDFISDLAIIYCGSIDGLRFKSVAVQIVVARNFWL